MLKEYAKNPKDTAWVDWRYHDTATVPGAGNLDQADETGVKTYCLGHDWFEDSQAPYPVYDVKTDQQVYPAAAVIYREG